MTASKIKKVNLFFLLLVQLSIVLPAQDAEVLDAFIRDQVERFRLPGAALTIVRGDSMVFSRGYGEGIAAGRPHYIGSLSKVFTATAVMQLVEAGKVKLADPVAVWLPEITFEGPEAERLNVEQLLRHSSGLIRKQGFTPLPDLEQLQEQGFRLRLYFPPGTQETYSNLNYQLLGLIIERAAQQSYAGYIHEQVFAPLEMNRSFAGSAGAMGSNPAQGYRFWFGFPFEAGPENYLETAVPSGFLISCTEDVGHFLTAQLQYGRYGSQQLLTPESIAYMHEAGSGQNGGRGIGWNPGDWNGSPVWQHSGATATSYAYMAVLPEKNTGFIFMTNINAFNPIINSIEAIPKGIFQYLNGAEPEKAEPLSRYLLMAFGLVLLLSVLDLAIKAYAWLRAGMPLDSGDSRFDLLKLVFWKLLLPVGLTWALLTYFEIPLNALLGMQPDIGWTIVFSIFAGFAGGFLEHFTKMKQNT